MGYHVYRLDFSKTEDPLRPEGLRLTEHAMENSLVRVEFDRKTGAIRSYFDKTLNRELFKNSGALPVVLEDWDDTWGHKIKAYDKEIGWFKNPTFKTVENGPERIRLQVKSFWGDSFIVQDFSLYRESAELECKLTVNWHEKYRVLKLRFPSVLEKGKCTYAIPYGFIERDMNGDEEPGQEWIFIDELKQCVKYGC